ncbi:MAG TPA: PQ-loop repeat-containing protein [Nitrospirae bacterium]|nr:PQ-loop repeat-containing protein [Nitrospirota bacterium]HDK16746.1 PQ-loop repeat-containing protein [Nitrospirota bacterium]HDK81418.1 PQ-loop repeat-containing protein [Nitrospirota bacterium]HDO25303.1 PQ-loop repeat-containing protein [Nitrospirota bacterium]
MADNIKRYYTGSIMADLIGWIGSVAFAVCGFPQAWECFKSKSAKGISPVFVGLWLTGEVCYVISVLMKFGWVTWMMFNYLANLVSIAVIGYYMVKDKKTVTRNH